MTSDGYTAYLEAVESAFGDEVDYAMLSKVASREELEIRKQVISGDPDPDHISTSMARTAKPDVEDVVAAVHPEDQWVLEKDGEPRPRGHLALSALQLCADSFGDQNDAGDGRRCDGQALRSRLDSRHGGRGVAQATEAQDVSKEGLTYGCSRKRGCKVS